MDNIKKIKDGLQKGAENLDQDTLDAVEQLAKQVGFQPVTVLADEESRSVILMFLDDFKKDAEKTVPGHPINGSILSLMDKLMNAEVLVEIPLTVGEFSVLRTTMAIVQDISKKMMGEVKDNETIH